MICTNPSSNLRLRSGIAPREPLPGGAGVRVALGLDEAGINDDRDMLQEMRLALRLHRVPGMDDDVPTSAQIFRMATADGAATTPFGERIGELAVGRAADLVLLPWRSDQPSVPRGRHVRSSTPSCTAPARRPSTSCWSPARSWCARAASRGSTRPPSSRSSPRRSAAPLTPDEEHRRRLGRAVFPHVRKFYEGWLDPGRWIPSTGRARGPEGAVTPPANRQGAPCRKRSAQAWVASRYRRPCSTLGSISLPSCHSFQLETRIHGGSADERGPPRLVVGRALRALHHGARRPDLTIVEAGSHRRDERPVGPARQGRIPPIHLAHRPAPRQEHDRRVDVERVEAREPVRPRREPLGARRVGHEVEAPPCRRSRARTASHMRGRSRCDA